MKKLAIKTIVLVWFASTLMLVSYPFQMHFNEVKRLRNIETILVGENRLLHEQINDLLQQLQESRHKIAMTPSYETGFSDALIRMDSGSFNDGYLAAKQKYENKSYVDGYHQAIGTLQYAAETQNEFVKLKATMQNKLNKSK